jgi:glycerol kinase
MDYILALDAGTSSVRAVAFDLDGNVLYISQRPLDFYYNAKNVLCQDPKVLVDKVLQCIDESVAQQESGPLAVAITNQRESFALLDRHGSPITPLISWQDRSTERLCEDLRDKGFESETLQRTGLPLDPYFSGSKVLAMAMDTRDPLDGSRFATVDTIICSALTGGKRFVTDPSNASRTLMFDTRSLTFSPELLELFRATSLSMPEVVSSFPKDISISGDVLPSLDGVPIAAILGDQQASLIGQSATGSRRGKITYGTGAFAMISTGASRVVPPSRGVLGTIAYSGESLGTCYALEGASFSAGSVLTWLKENAGLIDNYDEIDTMGKPSFSAGSPVFIPAFDGIGSPHMVSNTQAAIFGLSHSTTRKDIVLSVVEGVVNSITELLAAMKELGGAEIETLRVDGGLTRSSLICQLQADSIGVTLQRSQLRESTAYGAFAGASYSLGLASDLDEAARHNQVDTEFRPTVSNTQMKQRYGLWSDRVNRTVSYSTRP